MLFQKITRRMRQIHNVLALVVGTQILLWMGSGLYFTLFPIETVRGEHLRAPQAASSWI